MRVEGSCKFAPDLLSRQNLLLVPYRARMSRRYGERTPPAPSSISACHGVEVITPDFNAARRRERRRSAPGLRTALGESRRAATDTRSRKASNCRDDWWSTAGSRDNPSSSMVSNVRLDPTPGLQAATCEVSACRAMDACARSCAFSRSHWASRAAKSADSVPSNDRLCSSCCT